MQRTKIFPSLLAATLLTMLHAERCRAAPGDSDLTLTARELSDQGLRHYQNGEHDAAIESFMASYALSNNPGLLYNVAQAYRLKGDCSHAKDYYERYLAAVPTSALKPSVDERIAELKECSQAVAKPPEAGKAREAPASVRGAAPQSSSGAANIAAHTETAAPSRWARPAVIGTAAAAALLAGVGVVFAIDAHASESRLESRYESIGVWDDAAQQELEAGRRYKTLSIVSLVGAGISAGVAVWLGLRGGHPASNVALGVDGSLTLGGRF